MRQFLIIFVCMILQTFSMHAGQNKVALITGASKGVGLATAEHLANNGFTVYGTVRPSNKATLPVKETLHFLPVDLMDETSIQAAVQTILEKEGHIDILINNAGYALIGPVEALTTKEIQDKWMSISSPLLSLCRQFFLACEIKKRDISST